MPLTNRHLLGIDDLSVADVERILEAGRGFREILSRPIKKVPTLRGKTLINVFYEPSTRTRSSFEIAAKVLSADAINFGVSSSSVSKGESLIDTALSLQAMNPDIIVVRHGQAGAPHLIARHCKRAHVINGGDGTHEHPSQALLDAFTMLEHKPRLAGLRVAIVGDISHSRVARSNCLLLRKMGAEVVICGPPTLIPRGVDDFDVEVTYSMKEALRGADVIMMLRSQRERQTEIFYPSIKEYFALYGLNEKKMRWARKDTIVMHPGPINRGVEIDPALAEGEYSVILDQVTNGVAIRMALLFLLLGTSQEEQP